MCQMQCCSNYNKTTLQLNNNWNVASDISQNRQAAKSIFSMDISDYAASFIGIQRHQNHVYWLRPPEPNSLNRTLWRYTNAVIIIIIIICSQKHHLHTRCPQVHIVVLEVIVNYLGHSK